VIGYIIAQVVGGIIAAAILYVVASGKAALTPPPADSLRTAMANTPGGFSMLSAIVIDCPDLRLPAGIHGATDKRRPAGFALSLVFMILHPNSSNRHAAR
jgi:aquaporin Z